MRKYSTSYQKLFKAALATTVATGAFVSVAPLSIYANEAGPAVFKDLNENAHYYSPVLNLSARGIVKGYADGTFKPNNSVTRGQAAKILANTLGLDTVNVQNPGFTDVKTTDEYYGPIAALAQAGIINGYDDKTFKPNNNLKRSQMAKIITLGFGLEETALTDTRFKDVKSSDAYAGYVQAMLTNNITTGTTATTFEPNALVTRGQIASFVVRSEAAVSVSAPADVTSEIVNITNNTVELANGKTYRLASTIKSLVNPTNLAVLKGATVKVTEQDGQIGKISSIAITASGNATSHLVLNGEGAALAGDLKVNGDYVSIKNVVVEGNLEIGNNVKNSFLSDGITVKGKTIISDDKTDATAKNEGKMYRSIAFVKPFSAQTAAEEATNKPVIVFSNSSMGTIEVSKNDVVIEATGTTSVQALVVSSNVHLKAETGVSIPQVTIAEGVTLITIDAPVANLVINTNSDLKIEGTGDLGAITIESNKEVKFETTGKVSQVTITSKDSKVEFGANTKVGNLVLPEGVNAKDVIGNYDSIKGNIDTIGGKDPVVTPPTTTPTPPTGGNGGGTTTPPQPDQGAIDRAAAAQVTAMITALPAAENVTVAHKAQINAARSAYNRLTVAQRNLVTNTAKLTEAETALAVAESEVTVSAVKELIQGLPAEDAVTINDKKAIETARAAYNKLTAVQQNQIDITKLTAAEAALEAIEKDLADKEAAAAVTKLIAQLPVGMDVTIDHKEVIENARKAYADLTDDQKALVIDVARLEDAEIALLAIERELQFSQKIKEELTGFESDLLAFRHFDDETNQVTYEIMKPEQLLVDIEGTGFLDDLLNITEIRRIQISDTSIEIYGEDGELTASPSALRNAIGRAVLNAIGKSEDYGSTMQDLVDKTLPIVLTVNDNGTQFNASYTFKFTTLQPAINAAQEAVDGLADKVLNAINSKDAQRFIKEANEKVEIVRQFDANLQEISAWVAELEAQQLIVDKITDTENAIIDLADKVAKAENVEEALNAIERAQEKFNEVKKWNSAYHQLTGWEKTLSDQRQEVADREAKEALDAAIKAANTAIDGLADAVKNAKSWVDAQVAVEDAQDTIGKVKKLDGNYNTTAWDLVISEQQDIVDQRKATEESEEAAKEELRKAIIAAEDAIADLPNAVKIAVNAATAELAIEAAQIKVAAVLTLDKDYNTLDWDNVIDVQKIEVEKKMLHESFDQIFTELTQNLKTISGTFNKQEKKIDIAIPTESQSLGGVELFTGTGLKSGLFNLLLSPHVTSVNIDSFMIDTLDEKKDKKTPAQLNSLVEDIAYDWIKKADEEAGKDVEIKPSTGVGVYLLGKPKVLIVYGQLQNGNVFEIEYTLEFN